MPTSALLWHPFTKILESTQEIQLQNAKNMANDAKRSQSAGSLVFQQHPKLAGSVWKVIPLLFCSLLHIPLLLTKLQKAITGANDPIGTIDVSFPSVPPGLIETFGSGIQRDKKNKEKNITKEEMY